MLPTLNLPSTIPPPLSHLQKDPSTPLTISKMLPHTQYPDQSRQPPPHQPHPHRTRYYARRVKESFTSRLCKFICTIILSLLLIIGLVAFIVWLSLRPHRPRFHVVSFSIAGLLGQDNGFQNSAITFNVTIRNPNNEVDIYYDDMSGGVFYLDQQLASTTTLLLQFRQRRKNTTYVSGAFTGVSLPGYGDSFKQALATGKIVFRLELKTGIRFRIARWTTRHHRMHASCVVGVGPDGLMLSTYKGRRCSIYFS